MANTMYKRLTLAEYDRAGRDAYRNGLPEHDMAELARTIADDMGAFTFSAGYYTARAGAEGRPGPNFQGVWPWGGGEVVTDTITKTVGLVFRLSAYCDVEYDNPEHGAGFKKDGTEALCRWGKSVDFLNTVISVKDRANTEKKLAAHLECWGFTLSDFIIFDEGDDETRLTMNRDEDNDGDPMTDEEAKRRDEQLYLVDYDLMLTILPDDRGPTVAELRELFPGCREY